MSNNNQNNPLSWKTKLDELDSLPGEAIPNKEMAWEKLHERMKAKPARKRTWFYWVAAACILAVLLNIVFKIGSWDTNQGDRYSEKQNITKNSSAAIQNKQANNFTPNDQQSATLKQPVEIKDEPNRMVIAKKAQEPVNTVLQKKQQPVIAAIPVSIVDTKIIKDSIQPLNIAINIPPAIEKKKLRVMRINELPGSFPGNDDLNNNSPFRRFVKSPVSNLSVGVNTNHILIKNLNAEN